MKTNPLHSLAILLCAATVHGAAAGNLEDQFRELPMEARRLTGPLFWLHGDTNETPERLGFYLEKVAEGGNGCFTAESRPHSDWLGPNWYRDLGVCLEAAKKNNLKMWIFDERWWPSQSIGGRVPPKYAAKSLVAETMDASGPNAFESAGFGGERYIGAVAGRLTEDNRFEGDSLLDLAPFIQNGKLVWQPPRGKWRIVRFTHKQAPGLGQRGGKELSVDGASRDCTEWFIQTVYQPHYERFKGDFGTTIPGFFYDEPETVGDWGTELDVILREWGADWKKAYVAYKFQLAGDDDAAARYQYLEAFAEAWGRVMYGGMTRWCEARGVASIGHFMEHNMLYVNPTYCAGDMMRLQKYSSMGGIDLVVRQMYPGQRPQTIYQTPKLGSSISHVYGKKDDLAMCEIFGGYNQNLTYPQMKWLTDQHQVRGINFLIPHSFNPKAPYDRDYPPYFYNDGHEPRWPLYRVWADYTSRLSLLLTGGRHVCPVAILFSGNARRVGNYVTPEDMTTTLQDALYDCDWLPFEAFESNATLDGANVALHGERYQVLVVPPTELIPAPTLAKVKSFFDQGGVVIGYGRLPSKSGTVGTSSADIEKLRRAIWGDDPKFSTAASNTNAAGGRAYFLPEKPDVATITAALHRDAGIPPVVEVVSGETDNWLHVLHRVKEDRDVFLVCNQDHLRPAKTFELKLKAEGFPEIWDPMRNAIQSVPFSRTGDYVVLTLTLEPMESALIVFNQSKRTLSPRLTSEAIAAATSIPVAGGPVPPPKPPRALIDPSPTKMLTLSPVTGNPFEGTCELASTLDLATARVVLEMEALEPEEAARVTINGQDAGGFIGRPLRLEVTRQLKPGANTIRIEPFAPRSARLVVTKSAPESAAVHSPGVGSIVAGTRDRKRAAARNPFFAMDTALGNGKSWPAAELAALIKELGYDGFGASGYPSDEFLAAFEQAGLKVYNDYLMLSFDPANPGLDPRLKQVVPRLKGHDTALWIAINGVTVGQEKLSASDPRGDEIVASALRELADLAQTNGVRIALYPHTRFWLERVSDTLRVARKVNRPNVGVTFNLCHWLKVEGSRDPKPVLTEALPALFFVTINGADVVEPAVADWTRLIQPLDAGDYDVGGLVKMLHDLGYDGPIGFQGFGIKGDPRSILQRTMTGWRRLNSH